MFSRKIFAIAGFLVVSLYIASRVLSHFMNTLPSRYSLTPLPLPRFGYFLLYCGLIFLFLILFHKQRKSPQIWFLFLVRLVLFAIIGFLGFQVGLSAVMIMIMSAYAEEFLKIGATENALKKADFYSSDVLFLSLLVALGFSIVENVFYVGQQALGGEMNGIFALIFGRGLFSSLIHLISTGTIALLLYKLYQSVKFQSLAPIQKVLRVVMCMLVGVALHLGYNILVGQVWVYVLVVIGGYFLLSYVLFLSDSLYKNGE